MVFRFSTTLEGSPPIRTRPPPPGHKSPDHKRPKAASAGKTADEFESKVELKIPIECSNDIRDKVAATFAEMQQADATLRLVAWNATDENEHPSITTGTSVPSQPETLKRYVVESSSTRRQVILHMRFISDVKISTIKCSPKVFPFLQRASFHLNVNHIQSTNIGDLGWAYEEHQDFGSPSSVLDKVKTVLPSELHDKIQVRLQNIRYQREIPDLPK